ncbi:MAG: Mut7-C RNAse domain-containing protein [Chloroflexota bacterium]
MSTMRAAQFRFHGILNDFLPGDKKHAAFTSTFQDGQSIKHLIESLGIPHTEVGQIVVNGKTVDVNYLARDYDQVEIHPAQPGCPIEPRFLLDSHLGKLTTYLRILGFDCLYRNDYTDKELIDLVLHEKCILLTRDRRLLMRKVVTYGYCLHSLEPQEQLLEVVRRFDLISKITPFRRCLRCNHPLEPISKEAILERLEPLTKRYYEEFHHCPSCDQIYWKGSHYERMLRLIDNVVIQV